MKHFTLHHLWRLAAVLLAILIYPAQSVRGNVEADGESAAGLVSTHHHWELATTSEIYKLGTMRTSEGNDWNVFIKDPNAGVNTASMHSNTTGNSEKMLDIEPSGNNRIEVTLNNMNTFAVSGVVSKVIVNASGGFRTMDALIGEKNSTKRRISLYLPHFLLSRSARLFQFYDPYAMICLRNKEFYSITNDTG